MFDRNSMEHACKIEAADGARLRSLRRDRGDGVCQLRRWIHGVWPRLVAMVMVLSCFAGCAKPKPTLVVVVGGLGISQLGDLRRAVERECPQAKVVNAGGWDGYKADLTAIATAKPRQHIIFVGHSFGCGAIAQAAAQLPKVDLAVFIDPAWNDFRLPRTIGHYLWFKRSGFGLEREATIVGAAAPRTIHGGHNDIPHAPELIAGVVSAINGIRAQKDAPPEGGRRGKSAVAGKPVVAGAREGGRGS